LRLAEWVREALLSAPVELGPDSGEVALGEILALRSLLLNLHFRAAKGEPVAEAEMCGLIERADGSKMHRARERLEAVHSAALAAVGATDPEPEELAEGESKFFSVDFRRWLSSGDIPCAEARGGPFPQAANRNRSEIERRPDAIRFSPGYV
jgi:hypothetical protein